MMFKIFLHYHQLESADCGPSCLRMIAKYYGRNYSVQYLREQAFITREGVSMLGISDAAERIGFRTMGVKVTLEQLRTEVPLPCVLHWNQNYFVVLYKVKNGKYYIADPATKKLVYEESELARCWCSTVVEGKDTGAALLFEPGPDFYDREEEDTRTGKGLSFFFRYLTPYRRELFQLVLGMLTASILQLILPFLTQSMVDTGIRDGNLSFITLILVAQLVIFVAKLSVDFIRSWILLHVNTRINIALISDFLAKLMRLPLHFFDTKMVGDIMQRIGDHNRIETFMTGSSISTLFSFVNFIVFGFVLAYYDLTILVLFLVGNGLYVAWILAFMKYRRELDIKRFAQAAGEQSNLFQLVTGMQEIKLNNCETEKRWEWERIQVKLFKISIKGLALQQYQQLGSVFFNQTTNILISFLAARAVVSGEMTLGMMMSLTYIVGQLTAPIEQFIGFARSFQDAKISLERLGEIHQKEDEEQTLALKTNRLPEERTLRIEDVCFSYDGADRDYVLEHVSLAIPEHKVTAVVGASGSGKTSFACRLCKYLTRFGRVAYNSLEEGDSLSLQRSFEDVNMMEVSGKLVLLDQMPIEELSGKLAMRKSWDIVLVDSIQYTGMSYAQYKKLRQRHPDKLFVFISHAKGSNPDGKVAERIMYDSGCKIYIEGFRADAKSRYLDEGQHQKPFVIWRERASLYWGDQLDKSNMGE